MSDEPGTTARWILTRPPRDFGGEEQYVIWRLRGHPKDPATELELVATCGTKEAVGVAIVTLAEEGEFDGCTVGLMHRPFDDKPGTWLANPWPPIPRSGDSPSGKKIRQSEGTSKPKKGKR